LSYTSPSGLAPVPMQQQPPPAQVIHFFIVFFIIYFRDIRRIKVSQDMILTIHLLLKIICVFILLNYYLDLHSACEIN
jgi:hypothetical protein